MAALNDVYWKHKIENRQRFTPKNIEVMKPLPRVDFLIL